MDYSETAERISQKVRSKGHEADAAKIEGKLRRLVEEFGVPPAEAERTVANELAREFSITGLGTAAGEEKQLNQLLAGEWATVEAKVVSLSSSPSNILRDVGADYARGRLYLPEEDLDRFACKESDIASGALTPPVVAVLRHQAERAHGFYRRARGHLPREDARRLVAAEIMGAIYQAILHRIERRGFDVFSEVVRVPRPHRALIAATTWARVVAGL